MADLSIDGNDLWALPIWIAGTLGSLDLLSLDIGGYGLDTVLISMTAEGHTTEITVGIALAMLALGWVLWTNDLGWRGWTGIQLWVVLATVWLVLSPPFVPIMESIIMSSGIAKLVAFTLQTVGFSTISYLG